MHPRHSQEPSKYFFSKPNLSEWAVGEFNEVDLEKNKNFEKNKALQGSCCLALELAANTRKIEVASFGY